MSDDTPGLQVGFSIAFGDSFAELARLEGIIDASTADALKRFAELERGSKGAIDMTGATATMKTFGVAATRELQNVSVATARAEKSAEGMIRQLERQASTFGKSASEIREMNAELRAVEAESRGLTEVAARLRAASAAMKQLEQGTGRLPGPTNAARASMQNLGFQVQDFAVQVVGGTSALLAFAMQAPQAAGALTGFGGTLGKVGAFLAGPWGIAITLATTVLAGFADKLFQSGNDATKAAGKIDIYTSALIRMANAAGKATMADRGFNEVRLRQLQGWRDNPDADPNGVKGGNRAGDIARAVRRKELDAQIAALEATNAGVDKAIAAQGRLTALGRADAAALKAASGARRAHNKELRETASAAREAAKEAEKLAKWGADFATDSRVAISDIEKKIREDQLNWGKGMPTVTDKMLAADLKKQTDADEAAKGLQSYFDTYIAGLDRISARVDEVADNMRHAFGSVGGAIGDVITTLDEYGKRASFIEEQRRQAGTDQAKLDDLKKQDVSNQLSGMIALTGAAKGLFNEHSKGYKVMAAAEKALTILQLARTAVAVANGAASMFAFLGPFGFPAVAAMLGVMASLGFKGGGGSSSIPKANDGTGTIFGDTSAKSDSIARSISALKDIDTLMLSNSRDMLASLRSIDSQIGGFTALVLRAGDINASGGVATGFAKNGLGKGLEGIITGGGILSKIPVIGGIIGAVGSIIGSLFGSKTSVVGSGLFGGPQDLQSILSGGFDASYYSDIQKKKKFFGITTGTSYSTNYSGADPALANQFTLILKSFNDAIKSAAGPLGAATSDIEARLNGFVVNIGKIDLQGLTGEEIQDKLSAVFGAAADDMANAAFPGITRFQKVGEGAFETLVRVASTVEQVTAGFMMLGRSVTGMSIDIKMAVADQFESVSALASATSSYFETYYTKQEQAAARTAQFGQVFASLGFTLPSTLAGFRALVEAQDLTTAAGQAAYATLLQLAPAFAELQAAMNGAKSAADILAEREDLNRRLLELQGNTAAIRALDLANLDASNRALQQQIWALQDAQTAAAAAEELRKAWKSVGDSIMDEVERIRGLSDAGGGDTFASLSGQFNALTSLARGGDQDAAKSLPGISQALLQAAALSATSQQELRRIQALTAASLEATYGAIGGLMGATPSTTLANAASAVTANSTASNDNPATSLVAEVIALRAEIAGMRAENNAGHAKTGNAGERVARKLDDLTTDSGGNAIATMAVV